LPIPDLFPCLKHLPAGWTLIYVKRSFNANALDKRTFLILALFTLIGFSLLGYWIIENFLPVSFEAVIAGEESLWMQLAAGAAFGLVSAFAGWKIIETPLLYQTRIFFSKLIKGFNLSFSEILFVSICAGIGEEILFRGAIQPMLGVWLTAIIFVGIHGYLNPFNWRLSIYGVFMTFAIAGVGYLKIHFGIAAAIAAHSVIDIFLLYKLARDSAPHEQPESLNE